MEKKANEKSSLYILMLFSFLESFISPIPPDVFMFPIMVANPRRCFSIASVATITSLFGGMVGYMAGNVLFDVFGKHLIETYGLLSRFENIKNGFNEFGFWILILKGLTPIPFKLVAVSCGVMKYDFTLFLVGTIISRILRFFIPSVLFFFFQEITINIIKKYFSLFLIAILIITAFGIAMFFIN